jgi:ribonucleoside-triphosphate reductase
VITLNINRIVQQNISITQQISKIHKYQYAYRKIIEEYIEKKMLPQYSANFITLDKQFLTIGINGIVEAAESQGIDPNYNSKYIHFVQDILKQIYELNKQASQEYGVKFNTEFVPAENLGVKNAQWDRKSGLKVTRDCYNSYLYPVEDITINTVEKFKLHGREIIDYLDGGSALHLNLEEHLSYQNALNLFNIAAQTGCNYFTTNVKTTICNECGHIDMNTLSKCPKCNSHNVDYATRVIGYLKRVSSFSSQRQNEAKHRYYHAKKENR